jgi:hypothetical protein
LRPGRVPLDPFASLKIVNARLAKTIHGSQSLGDRWWVGRQLI